MSRRIHWEVTTAEAKAMQHKLGGELLSKVVHPEQLGESIRKFKAGEITTLVCDHTMMTGWRVEGNDIDITFGRDWGEGDSQARRQAIERVKRVPLAPGQLF